jgi:hypothetical protein
MSAHFSWFRPADLETTIKLVERTMNDQVFRENVPDGFRKRWMIP